MTKHRRHYNGVLPQSSRAIGAAALALVILTGSACWSQEQLMRLPSAPESADIPAASLNGPRMASDRGPNERGQSPVPLLNPLEPRIDYANINNGFAASAFAQPVTTPLGLPQPSSTGPAESSLAADFATYVPRGEPWSLQWVPDGLIYHSYLAGMKEPRIACSWVHERELGWIWDITLGGRVAVLRYGTDDPRWPEGWEVDIEGAAFPRLDIEEDRDLVSCDYRFGIPVTYGGQRYRTKLAYYHLSSHLGDEFMLKHPTARRINYSRDVIVWGHSLYLLDQDLRLYAEAGWAFHVDGGSKPWEFQFGVAYSPAQPTGTRGSPFVAVNAHLREEVDFGGNLVVEAGWQWRGETGRLLRLGSQYYTGMSEQFEFYDDFEDKVGLGIWYDF